MIVNYQKKKEENDVQMIRIGIKLSKFHHWIEDEIKILRQV